MYKSRLPYVFDLLTNEHVKNTPQTHGPNRIRNNKTHNKIKSLRSLNNAVKRLK